MQRRWMRRRLWRRMWGLGIWTHRKKSPKRFRQLLLQWHVTDRCNLRCSHCYQKQWSGPEPDMNSLALILEQFTGLCNDFECRFDCVTRGHINVTGGEPFLHSNFLDLLSLFRTTPRLSYAILTNGTMIDRSMAYEMHRLGPRFVQVSIEGTRATHDSIRGSGNFETTVEAIRNLVRAGVPVLIAFTAHRSNYREFPEVARLGCRLGVARVWADRMIPADSGFSPKVEALSREETREFIELIASAQVEAKRKWFLKTEISMHRALQFLAGGRPYHCTAGDNLITIMPNGDLYPCRRMPIRVGNVLEESLTDIYWNNPLFHALRDRNRMSETCRQCASGAVCRGGLRCLSYAASGDPFERDPGCWL
jgi:radical SAM protein with 4Fe4S-binding SPASM domain